MSLPQVTYRRLGQSGLKVSVPILGGLSFGHPDWAGWVIKEEEALPILKAAWDRGINTWDTANMYSNGESERIIAKSIEKYNIPRHKLIILTKCFFIVGEAPGTKTAGLDKTRDYVNQTGLSRAAIFNQVEASLERLKTNYIDVLQIHRFDYDTPAEETMEALHDLVKSGKVRYIGASSMWTWQFQHLNHVAEKHNWTQFISMQNRHSLLYREEEREMNKYCEFAGIGLIPWGPLHFGQLARPAGQDGTPRSDYRKGTVSELKTPPATKEIIERVEKLSKEKSWSMAQVAIAWSNAKVTSPIVGFSSVKRLEEAIIPDKQLTEDEIKFLEEPYIPAEVAGHS